MFYPFGFGHRSCIGRLFAMVEAKVILAQLLHNFDIKLSDDYKLELTFSITFRPANAITCTLTPRKLA
jgi:unspecific monooxygenase